MNKMNAQQAVEKAKELNAGLHGKIKICFLTDTAHNDLVTWAKKLRHLDKEIETEIIKTLEDATASEPLGFRATILLNDLKPLMRVANRKEFIALSDFGILKVKNDATLRDLARFLIDNFDNEEIYQILKRSPMVLLIDRFSGEEGHLDLEDVFRKYAWDNHEKGHDYISNLKDFFQRISDGGRFTGDKVDAKICLVPNLNWDNLRRNI